MFLCSSKCWNGADDQQDSGGNWIEEKENEEEVAINDRILFRCAVSYELLTFGFPFLALYLVLKE